MVTAVGLSQVVTGSSRFTRNLTVRGPASRKPLAQADGKADYWDIWFSELGAGCWHLVGRRSGGCRTPSNAQDGLSGQCCSAQRSAVSGWDQMWLVSRGVCGRERSLRGQCLPLWKHLCTLHVHFPSNGVWPSHRHGVFLE